MGSEMCIRDRCIERQGVGGVYNSVDSIERGKPREKKNAACLGRLG